VSHLLCERAFYELFLTQRVKDSTLFIDRTAVCQALLLLLLLLRVVVIEYR